ncbi:hypothetical protein OROMI_019977 [Orobanche minor]
MVAGFVVAFVLRKLDGLLQEKRSLLRGVERDIILMEKQFANIKDFLRDADVKVDSDPSLKLWVSDIREISLDLEDILDQHMLQFGGSQGRRGRGVIASVKNLWLSLDFMGVRGQTAKQIKGIKQRLDSATVAREDFGQLYKRIGASCSTDAGDKWKHIRSESLLLEDDKVVDIEVPKQQLLDWIHSKDGGVNIITVVGVGGLGKTTLVKKVFDDVTDVENLLRGLIHELTTNAKVQPPRGIENMSTDGLRKFIYTFLHGKKYMVVLDDTWYTHMWDGVISAFPGTPSRGCIIKTTRIAAIDDIGFDHQYHLQPLSLEESRTLFYRRAFPRDHQCPSDLSEFSEDILQKCAGLPLALAVIGGVLTSKGNRVDEWMRFSRSLIPISGSEDFCVDKLSIIVSLSYDNLPYTLKYCVLSLSIFPGNGLWATEETIRLWIAEGFVEAQHGEDGTLEDVAQKYVNELANKSLLQVIHRDAYGSVSFFCIHDLVRGYITAKSIELNMVTICDGELHRRNRIHHLSIQKKSASISRELDKLNRIRSLVVGHDVEIGLGLIEELLNNCRLLRVLYFGADRLQAIPDGKTYLINLETLDLGQCNVTKLPNEILKLEKRRHLIVHKRRTAYDVKFDHTLVFKAPSKIGSCLTQLQSLSCVDASEVGV